MKKYLNKVFHGFPTGLQIVLLSIFLFVGCEGLGLYVISTAGTASGTYITKKYLINKDTKEVGQIFQLKDGRWITNKGIILKNDDPKILHLK